MSFAYIGLSVPILSLLFSWNAHAQSTIIDPFNQQMSTISAQLKNPTQDAADNYATYMGAKANFLLAWSNALHNLAQAELTYAIARHQEAQTLLTLQEVNFWRKMLTQFTMDLQDYRKKRHRAHRIVDHLHRYGDKLKYMTSWGLVSQSTVLALKKMLLYMDNNIATEFHNTKIEEELLASDFVPATHRENAKCSGTQPMPYPAGGKIFKMIEWAYDHCFDFDTDGMAFEMVMEAAVNMDASVKGQIDELLDEVESLKQTNEDYWLSVSSNIRRNGGTDGFGPLPTN